MKSVYVISAGELSQKIGIADNPYSRVMDLQCGSPVPLEVVFAVEAEDAHIIERAAHQKLAALRQHGEWFACYTTCAAHAITSAIEEREQARLDAVEKAERQELERLRAKYG